MLYFASFCISAKLVKNSCDVRTDMQARRYSHQVHITEQVSQKKNSITKHNRLTRLFAAISYQLSKGISFGGHF